MRIVSRCLFLLAYLLAFGFLRAQTAPPATGGAMGAARGESIPINPFTGIPAISMPLCSFSHPCGLSLNLSMDYFAGGIKIAESGAPYGLGWNINAGGTIVRTVRGIPDDCPRKGSLYTKAIAVDPRDSSYKYMYGVLDGELDVFQFNFPGHSGKFYIGKDSQCVITPLSKLKIQLIRDVYDSVRTDSLKGTLRAFLITAEDGSKYYFNDKEYQNTYVASLSDTSVIPAATYVSYATAWNLTKITAYNGADTIGFKYVTGPGSTYTNWHQSVKIINGSVSHSDTLNTSPDQIITQTASNLLSQIIFPGNKKVDLVYNSPTVYGGLQRINFSDSVFRYGFLFSWDTASVGSIHKRLFLKKIEWFNATLKKKGYAFTYNSPHFTPNTPSLNSKDHWGYYNGANNHNEYVPTIPGLYTGADREPNSQAVASSLASVTDANGGITYYDFENNDRFPYKDSLNILSINAFSTTSTAISVARIIGKKTFFKIRVSGGVNRNNTVPITGSGQLNFYITNSAGTITYYSKIVDLYQVYYTGFTTFWCVIPSGSYLLKTNIVSGTSFSGTLPVTVSWANQSTLSTDSVLTGGIRIRRIRHFDPFFNRTDTLTTYRYKTTYGKSSGFLGVKPEYGYSLYNSVPTKIIESEAVNDLDYSESNNNGYSRVEVIKGTEAKNLGREVIEYTDLDDDEFDNSPPEYPFLPSLGRSYTKGLEKTRSVYDNAGRLLQRTVNTYNFINLTKTDSNYCSFKTGFAGYSGSTRPIQPKFYTGPKYYPLIGISQLATVSDTLFHPDSSITVRAQSFQFDSVYNLIKVTTPYDLNKNLSLEKRIYYPYNYTVGGALGKLRDSGIYSMQVATESWIIGDSQPRLLSANITGFKNAGIFENGLPFPNTIYALQSKAPVLQSVIGSFNPALLIRDSNYLKPQQNVNLGKRGIIMDSENAQSGIAQTSIYSADYSHIIANVSNAKYTDAAFTGFENGGEGGWTISSYSNFRDTIALAGIYSGNFSYINYISKTALNPTKTYIISYWTTGSLTIFGATTELLIDSRNGWNFYTRKISGTDSVHIYGSGRVDELRLYPENGNMITTSYDQMGQVISSSDANNTFTYYEYDAANRLQLVRDIDRKILKKYEYSDSLIGISLAPQWTALPDSTLWICELYNDSYNGNVLRKEIDNNPMSESYLLYRFVFDHYDASRCPLPVIVCLENPRIKLVNGICETACKVTTSSVYFPRLQIWRCGYYYLWSDSSTSASELEDSETSCEIGTVCP